jgi:hypothetical protein
MLGLAGLLFIAPALRGQDRMVSPTRLSPVLTSISLRATADTTLATAAIPQARLALPSSKVGRIVTLTVIGAVVGGAIGYYTAKPPTSCTTNCDDYREPRMLKGGAIGGSAGLALGVIVTLGGGSGPRLAMRSGR